MEEEGTQITDRRIICNCGRAVLVRALVRMTCCRESSCSVFITQMLLMIPRGSCLCVNYGHSEHR